jgi:hypothetical protein
MLHADLAAVRAFAKIEWLGRDQDLQARRRRQRKCRSGLATGGSGQRQLARL